MTDAHPTSPLRICRRCGIDAREARTQAEPICSDEHGLVTGHSYIDVDGLGRQLDTMAAAIRAYHEQVAA